MKHLLIIALALCAISCAPQRLNDGATMPWLIVSPDGMRALMLANKSPIPNDGWVAGLFTGTAIAELESDRSPKVWTHELAHAADACGSYWTALALITPPNPSPAMATRLANLRVDCESADRLGGTPDALWRVLFNRYGKEGVQHPEILRRLGVE